MMEEFFSAMHSKSMQNVHTCFPAVVESVDGWFVDCKPLVKFPTEDGDLQEAPILPDVPLIMPRGATRGIVWGVEVGDFVMVMVSEGSLDEWVMSSGDGVNSDDPRRFNLSDAVAIAGIFPYGFASTPPVSSGEVAMWNNEVSVKISKNGDVSIGGKSAQSVVKSSFLEYYRTHTHTTPAGESFAPTKELTIPTFSKDNSTRTAIE